MARTYHMQRYKVLGDRQGGAVRLGSLEGSEKDLSR